MNKTFCCKGKRLANYLIEHDCKILRIDCDQVNKNYLVFIFANNQELNIALESWKIDRMNYLF